MLNRNTLTYRRIIVEASQRLTHMLIDGHDPFPLTNAGWFPAGVYRGNADLETHTATITEEVA